MSIRGVLLSGYAFFVIIPIAVAVGQSSSMDQSCFMDPRSSAAEIAAAGGGGEHCAGLPEIAVRASSGYQPPQSRER